MRPFRTSPFLFLGFAALATLGAVAAFSATTGPSKGDPVAGKKTFKEKCVACHKVDGSGGVKLTGNPTPDWRDSTRMADPKFNDDYLRDCITNGKMKSGMVAWSKQGVRPEKIENLIAYIRTFCPPSRKSAAARDTSGAPKTAAHDSSSARGSAGARDTSGAR